MRYEYKTENVCSQVISFDIEGDVISNIRFLGGCNGNLKAISKMVDGWTVGKIEEILRETPESGRCVEKLLDAVYEKGAKDNATIIVCRIL